MHPSDPASDPGQELLGPRLTKGEARPLETQAKRHYRAAGRNLARFAVDLRRLQDGEAHLTRGFSSFGAYAGFTRLLCVAQSRVLVASVGAPRWLLSLPYASRVCVRCRVWLGRRPAACWFQLCSCEL
jgi:hypothetical protein